MKRTDLEKHLAKKIDGRLKSGAVPQRFGKGAAVADAKDAPAAVVRAPAAKLVAVSCRLPAELVNRLRTQAALTEGGMSAAVTQAVERWLAAADATPRG